MFGRKNVATAASDALDGVSPYVDQLATDEKLRKRLVAALTAGAAASKRAQKQTGLVGLATRLATDPVLRAQVNEATAQLKKANSRLRKHKSHKLRNTMLLLAGAGAIVAALPSLRETIMSKVTGEPESYHPPATEPVAGTSSTIPVAGSGTSS
jgi:hypothetical protein